MPVTSTNTSTTHRFSPRLNAPVSTDRQRDRGGRERDLAAAGSRAATSDVDGLSGRLREVAPEHDREQQLERVVLDVAAEPHDVREHDVEDAEQHQRPHQRPQVAEHRAEVADLELVLREREDDQSEPARSRVHRRCAADPCRRWPDTSSCRQLARPCCARRSKSCGQVREASLLGRPRHDHRGRALAAVDDAGAGPVSSDDLRRRVVAARAPGSCRTPPRRRPGRRPGSRRSRRPPSGSRWRRPPLPCRSRSTARSRGPRSSQLNSTRTLQVQGRPDAMYSRRSPMLVLEPRLGDDRSPVAQLPDQLGGVGAALPAEVDRQVLAADLRRLAHRDHPPRSSSSARWQKRFTASMSWVTNRIVRPSSRMRSNSR